MGYVLLGLVTLGVLVGLGQVVVRTNPHVLLQVLRYAVAAALVVFGAVFTIGRQVGLGLPMILAGLAAFRGRIGSFDLTGTSRAGKGRSGVRSDYLAMELDHGSGAMKGEVLKGAFAGRELDALTEDELRDLYDEVLADPDSLALLEAYLDRRVPGWREDAERDGAAGAGSPADAGAMTDQEAYEILGLAPGAGDAEIRAAHRRLMKGVHPDQGGSTFLAGKINQAKDRLLGRHR